MTMATPHSRFTPDDVLRLENQGLYELVNGRLIEKPISSLVSNTIGIVSARLVTFLLPQQRGSAYLKQSFRCFPQDADLVRRPDVAVVLAERRAGVPEDGHVPIAPDMAIEVLPPSDRSCDLSEKVAEYRSAGVKLIWIINPKMRVMRVYRADGTVSELTSDSDTVTGDPVLSGFSMPLRDLLPPAQPAVASAP
jgi:Uma2 family endonuclease